MWERGSAGMLDFRHRELGIRAAQQVITTLSLIPNTLQQNSASLVMSIISDLKCYFHNHAQQDLCHNTQNTAQGDDARSETESLEKIP